jgi:hypothetical protein
MATTVGTFATWLTQARIEEPALSAEQRALLLAAFRFRERCGQDYYSLRLLGHFLLHCGSGLKVAAIARLLDIHRTTASQQQGLSSKEVVQAAHHRLDGRPYGKLLPRYAGPIAQFLLAHPGCTWYDVLDFIHATWGVSVSTVALHQFVKKYGLDRATLAAVPAPSSAPAALDAAADPPPATDPAPTPSRIRVPPPEPAPGQPLPLPPRTFFLPPRATPGPSCSCPRP